MAETAKGNKLVVVHHYKRVVGDKRVSVHAHDRSTPNRVMKKDPIPLG